VKWLIIQGVGDGMSQLEPGASYIYERADGVTYARKLGSDPGSRIAIGWDSRVQEDLDRFRKDVLWTNILREAEHNSALQDALDRAKVIYELSRQNQSIDHHPV
jgi:hypothetical protein